MRNERIITNGGLEGWGSASEKTISRHHSNTFWKDQEKSGNTSGSTNW